MTNTVTASSNTDCDVIIHRDATGPVESDHVGQPAASGEEEEETTPPVRADNNNTHTQ